MEKNVIISIKGVQRLEDADPDTMELVTEGRLEQDGNSYTLSYQESELTGLEGTLTTFQVEPDRVTLLRVGEFNSQMVFQEGRRHLAMYNTPYGSMTIGVNTRHLHADLTERGGDIEIDYAIEIDHTVAGRNVFQINVREAGETASYEQVVDLDPKVLPAAKPCRRTGFARPRILSCPGPRGGCPPWADRPHRSRAERVPDQCAGGGGDRVIKGRRFHPQVYSSSF